VLVLVLAARLSAFSAAAAPPVASVAAVGLTVADMERSLAFFTTVLPFEKVADREVAGRDYERLLGVSGLRTRVATLRLGDDTLELVEYLEPRGRPLPRDSRSNDRWFQHVAIVVRDMDRAYARLRRHGVEQVSPEPQLLPAWNPQAGGIRAFYFKDPDGHPLELIQFPPGKGDPRWEPREFTSRGDAHREAQPSGGRTETPAALFLGIDHTAIVVRDTDASLRFYRDTLGLRVAGESENHGPEQERLNAVPGARLRITGLRAETGPGIELLEYLAPRDGRPAPEDLRANDLAYWQTHLRTPDVAAAVRALDAARFGLVSPGAIRLASRGLAFDHAALVRDPDGHAMVLVEP
jgi:catechol 2,3-dioxygenase-like lactoylglutathione lyase family enzyme